MLNPVGAPLQFALDELGQQSPILAQISSARIYSSDVDPTSYHLNTSKLQPKHILQCWTSLNGQLEICSLEQYFARRNVRGTCRIEFSILEQQDVAYIVWQWAIRGMGRGGYGGTFVLKKAEKGWLPNPELGRSWRS